jgi:nucleotide-binding universal stress UspA family protein
MVLDGLIVGDNIHEGGTGYIYHAAPRDGPGPGFAIVVKAPGIGPGEPTIGIESFEIEQMILPTLEGPHVPRIVGIGDLVRTPYIAMERIEGESVATALSRAPLSEAEVARIGAAIADALHSIHAQRVIHLDLKPENVMVRPNGEAVLLDFGFARHAHYPDLLGEERHHAAGSAAYVSPEQLRGDRSDSRSDLFALGVMLYELTTGVAPFGEPATIAGMRDRLWRAPLPPRALRPALAPWLQEIILHCLEPDAGRRYQSAALVAFDLRHPAQVGLTARAERTQGLGFLAQLARWWQARRADVAVAAPRAAMQPSAPVIMVAVDTEHPDDDRHPALLWTTRQIISLNAEFRLMFVSVIRATPLGDAEESVSAKHLEHKARLKHWIDPLKLPPARVSLHVIESGNSAETLLELARTNNVDLVVLGAPGPSSRALAWWRSVASSVTAHAPCSVHVVRVPEARRAHVGNPPRPSLLGWSAPPRASPLIQINNRLDFHATVMSIG